MSFKKYILVLSLLLIGLQADDSGSQYRKSGIHDANLVKTVFTNYGVIGLDASHPTWPRAAWIYDTNGYFINPIGGNFLWTPTISGSTGVVTVKFVLVHPGVNIKTNPLWCFVSTKQHSTT